MTKRTVVDVDASHRSRGRRRGRRPLRAGGFGGLTAWIALALLVAAGFAAGGATAAASPVHIGIVQFLEHPALDAFRVGFIQAIEDAGYAIGEDIIIEYHNAQGDFSVSYTIAEKFVQDRVDLIFAIATGPVQAAASLTDTIPIVFAGVRDPVGAEVVDSFQRPGRNITGTSHWTPVSEQIKLVLEIIPNARRIGVVYNSGELNSVIQVEEARQWAAEYGLTLVERTAGSTTDVRQAAESLVGSVDVIFIPTDNTVVAALESVLAVAERFRIPVIASDIATAQRGAAAAYGVDEIQLGRQAGEMALRILFEGADPATTPVEIQEVLDLAVNLEAAARMGLTIPEDVLERARYRY